MEQRRIGRKARVLLVLIRLAVDHVDWDVLLKVETPERFESSFRSADDCLQFRLIEGVVL